MSNLNEPRSGDNTGGLGAAELIHENLRDRHPDLVARSAELAGLEAFVPATIDSVDLADKVSEQIRQCTAFEKSAEAKRTAEKEPYLAGGRAVDGWFQKLAKGVSETKRILLMRRTVWDRKVEEEKRAELRRIAEEEARKAAELEREAQNLRELEQAQQAEADALMARAATKVKAAELTRTRTTSGVLTSLKEEWRFEIDDPMLVPREYLVINEQAIRNAIRAATDRSTNQCKLEIPGVRIYKHKMSVVR